MADKTTIEWTDATWNPVRGCAIVSKGCTNCYAMRQAHRSNHAGGAYEGLTQLTKGGPVWTGAIRTVPELLDAPLRWERPRRIFVNSMSDLFHEDVPEAFITEVWKRMADAPRHVFQILTKRPRRMRDYLLPRLTIGSYVAKPLANVWLGVSVEDQAAADERIPLLLQTPAAVRWISAEPLLGPVDISLATMRPELVQQMHDGDKCWPDWVVAGGESGPGARPMHPDWARALRDQCARVGVPFFFKQWGNWAPCDLEVHADERGREVQPHDEALLDQMYDRGWRVIEAHGAEFFNAGKKLAGRRLDGRTHDEYPA